MKINNKKHMDEVSDNKSIFVKIEEGQKKIRVVSDIFAVKEHQVLIDGKWKFIACPTENVRMQIAAGELPADTNVPPCPLCELGYPVKTSYLAMVVDRDEECAGILKKGPTILGAVQSLKDDEDWGNSEEYDIKIDAKGEGLKRKYTITGIPPNKSVPFTDKEKLSLDKLREEVTLEKMTTPRTYEQIKEIIGNDFREYSKEAETGFNTF